MSAAAASPSTPLQADKHIFSSVFPLKSHTVPTPEATPTIGSLAPPGTPFGGFEQPRTSIDEAVEFNRAWSIVTRYLTTSWTQDPNESGRKTTAGVWHAFEYLLEDKIKSQQILDWSIREVVADLRQNVLPQLSVWNAPITLDDAERVLLSTVQVLRVAHDRYMGALGLGAKQPVSRKNRTLSLKLVALSEHLRRDVQNAALYSLPRQRVQNTLASYLYQSMSESLSKNSNPEKCLKEGICQCQLSFDFSTLQNLNVVGLGGSLGERALALAVNRFLQGPGIERWCFGVDWVNQGSVVDRLRSWIETCFTSTLQQALAAFAKPSETVSTSADTSKLQFTKAAMAGLGQLRIHSLFNYVKTWPFSKGAILDIWDFLAATGPAEKTHLCASFTDQVQRRLLHAGASTNEILSFYINVIDTFKHLDSRGVLLEKVAIPIRSYLKSRDDAVNIVAASLLAKVNENGEVISDGPDVICDKVAQQAADSALSQADGRALNWNDMQWTPDPIDAGPLYKSSKTDDVLAYILGLFDSDDFIQASTAALGKQLLRSLDREMVMETKLVELLKTRFDSTKLQAAEVMLKDMRDSAYFDKIIHREKHNQRRAGIPTPREIQMSIPNEGISLGTLYSRFEARMKRSQFQAAVKLVANRRNDLYYPKRTRASSQGNVSESALKDENEMHLDVKIISGYFWPQMRNVQSRLPDQLTNLKTRYEEGFARLSGQRKLAWVHGESTVDLKLELEDRTIEEKGVAAWRAAILDAFADQPINDASALIYDNAIGLSASELAARMDMSEEHALDAINFWVSKRVLFQRSAGQYAILESLDMDVMVDADMEMTGVEDASFTSERLEDARLRENAPMFQTFIANMLRNTGAKEIGGMMGITSMLKMVLPIFTYGDDEVKSLLAQMESRGEVTRNGDLYSIVR